MKTIRLLELTDLNIYEKMDWIEAFYKKNIKHNYKIKPVLVPCDRGFSDSIYFILYDYRLKVVTPFIKYWNYSLDLVTNLKLLMLTQHAYHYAMKFSKARGYMNLLSMYEAMKIYSSISQSQFQYKFVLDNREHFYAQFHINNILEFRTKLEVDNMKVFIKRLIRFGCRDEIIRINNINSPLI